MDLKDAVVLVTGGSRGIGRETARMLIEGGARVAINGRDSDQLGRVAEEIGAFPVVADVASEEQVAAMVEAVVAHFGDLNVLINNAAYGYFSQLSEIDPAQFEQLFAVNVFGAMYAAKHASRHFIRRGGGTIINVGSTAGQKGFSGGTPYVATKFALEGMTQCWRYELRKYNIRVMKINPSEVLTEFAQTAGLTQKQSDRKLSSREIAHMIASMLTLDDRGMVSDLTVWATNPEG